jgi:hypothetical protein
MRARPSRCVAAAPAVGLFLAVSAAAVLAGCGGSSARGIASKRPAAIVSASTAAAASLKSVHVAISFGTPAGDSFEFVAGKGSEGTLAYGGATIQFIDVGNIEYEKSAALNKEIATLRHLSKSAAAQLNGAWLRSATSSASSGFPLTVGALLQSVLPPRKTVLAVGATTTVDGVTVVPVTDAKAGFTLYVAATGKPYPIQINLKTSGHPARIVFGGFGAPVTLSAPAHAISVAQLGK